jgi:hypothetical protein
VRKRFSLGLALAAAWIVCGSPAFGEVLTRDYGWEISPFVGYRVGGHFNLDQSSYDRLGLADGLAYGITIGREVNPEGALEVQWSRQESELVGKKAGSPDRKLADLKVDQYRFNGLYLFSGDKIRPFVLFGLGATRFMPGGEFGSETRFSSALGGGVKLYFGRHAGLRFDGRWTPTLFPSDSSLFCSGGGSGLSCSFNSTGQQLNQFEFTSGVIMRL